MDQAYFEQLVGQYMPSFMAGGIPERDADKMAVDMVHDAIKTVAQQGLDRWPENFDDYILREEGNDSNIKKYIDSRRAEGATDEDIRWWGNLPPIEKTLIEKADQISLTSAFIEHRSQGLDPKQAAEQVFQFQPKYGSPMSDHSLHRPLPYELKRRIIAYLEKCYRNPAQLRELVKMHGTLNAAIRHEMAQGRL